MKIAHLSDLHLFSEGGLRIGHLIGRRIFGALNLFLARHRVHSADVARAAVRAVLDEGVDHAVITGDMTNLALEAEFDLAASVVAPLGGYERLTVVPGNHDYYTPASVRSRRFEHHFGHTLWKEGDRRWGEYPAVKDLPGCRLVVVRSVTIAPPACAYGFVGEEQGMAVRAALDEAREKGIVAIVAMHHNLHRRKLLNEATGRLLDRWRVYDILRGSGADLVLHGHDHDAHSMEVPGPGNGERIRVVGCGSSSRGTRARVGGLNILDIDGKRIEIERWQYHQAEKRFLPLRA